MNASRREDKQGNRCKQGCHRCDNRASQCVIQGLIQNIIKEEAGEYFKGQKTAKEAADVIQSRLTIYVNEVN